MTDALQESDDGFFFEGNFLLVTMFEVLNLAESFLGARLGRGAPKIFALLGKNAVALVFDMPDHGVLDLFRRFRCLDHLCDSREEGQLLKSRMSHDRLFFLGRGKRCPVAFVFGATFEPAPPGELIENLVGFRPFPQLGTDVVGVLDCLMKVPEPAMIALGSFFLEGRVGS